MSFGRTKKKIYVQTYTHTRHRVGRPITSLRAYVSCDCFREILLDTYTRAPAGYLVARDVDSRPGREATVVRGVEKANKRNATGDVTIYENNDIFRFGRDDSWDVVAEKERFSSRTDEPSLPYRFRTFSSRHVRRSAANVDIVKKERARFE